MDGSIHRSRFFVFEVAERILGSLSVAQSVFLMAFLLKLFKVQGPKDAPETVTRDLSR